MTAISGLIAGLLFRSSSLPFQRWCRVPLVVSRCVSHCLGPLFASPPSTTNAIGYQPVHAQPAAEGRAPVRRQVADAAPGPGPQRATGAAAAAAAGQARGEPRAEQLLPGFGPVGGGLPAHVQGQMAWLMQNMAAAAQAPVNPAAVAQLVAMGFPEARVRTTLALAGGNVDVAAQMLLDAR